MCQRREIRHWSIGIPQLPQGWCNQCVALHLCSQSGQYGPNRHWSQAVWPLTILPTGTGIYTFVSASRPPHRPSRLLPKRHQRPARELLPWRRFLLEIPVFAHLVAKFHTFMEPKGSLPQSQKPNTFLIVRQINQAQTNPPFSLRYMYNITQPSIHKFSFRLPPLRSSMHFSSPLSCHMLSPPHPPDRITLKIYSTGHKS
jgi:hypothetical protein